MKIVKLLRIIGWVFFVLIFISIIPVVIGMGESNSFEEGAGNSLFDLTRWQLLPIGTMLIAFVFLFGASIVNWILNRRILNKGMDAEAKVISLKHTGETANDNPVVDFVLEVHPANQPAFMARARQLVSLVSLASLQPGTLVYVKFMLGNEKVVIMGRKQKQMQNQGNIPSVFSN